LLSGHTSPKIQKIMSSPQAADTSAEGELFCPSILALTALVERSGEASNSSEDDRFVTRVHCLTSLTESRSDGGLITHEDAADELKATAVENKKVTTK
jgi:hypothetical protein